MAYGLDSGSCDPAKENMTSTPDFGAFVISLDFELSWGVKDFLSINPEYRQNIAGEYEAVPAILDLFKKFDVAATWATVGLIFAGSAEEASAFTPKVRPEYENHELSPFADVSSINGDDRSLWFAPELIDRIRETPRQEVATHTFSHYYCLEPGQTAEAFAADLDSAIAIANKRRVDFRSIVFPRNQHNPNYDKLLAERGIACYRGNQEARMYQFDGETQANKFYRVLRLLDTYVNVSGPNTVRWTDLKAGSMVNIPASIFMRPVKRTSGVFERLQFKRIAKSMEDAARNRRVFHLWWHPHNFGTHLKENVTFLASVLEFYKRMEARHGMRSLNMSEVGSLALVADVEAARST